jgi:hypothetical protein
MRKRRANSHYFPWQQFPPVVHVDQAWRAGQRRVAIETQIEELAEKEFGGEFVGT